MQHAETDPLVTLFSEPLFAPQHGLPAESADRLTYERLRFLNQRIAPAIPLLTSGQRTLRELLELTAVVSPSVYMAFFLHHCMATGAVADYSAGADVVSRIGAGDSFGAVMMTELGYGSSSFDILTEAHHDPLTDEFLLYTPSPAAVKFPSNVGAEGVAKWVVVSARLKVRDADCGVFLFRLRIRDAAGPLPGVSIKSVPEFPQLQLDYASTSFDGARVPKSGWLSDGATITDGVFRDPLGEAGARTRRSVGVARFGQGANCLGLAAAARASLAIAVPYAFRRQANSRDGGRIAMIGFRNQQKRLLTAMASAFAATAIARKVSVICLRLRPPEETERGLTPAEARAAALAKVAVDQLAEGAIAQARASCGAFGHMRVNRLNEYHSFAVVLNNAGGDNQKCLIDAARSMVEGVEYEVPASVAAGPETLGFDDDVLRDCVKLLRHRESGLHRRLAAELADAMAGGADDFTAWNDRAELAQEFVEAHLARTVTEYFQDSAAECPDPQRRRLLRSLCELFALGRIAGHEGWYRETGFLPFSSAWSPSAAAGRVRDRLVPDLETLVRMLEIPPPLVLSPLAGERPVDGIMPSPIVPEMAATNAV